jgi:hypothetical protein
VGDLVRVLTLDLPPSAHVRATIEGRLGIVTYVGSPELASQLLVRLVGARPSHELELWLGTSGNDRQLWLRGNEIEVVVARFGLLVGDELPA